MEIQRGPTKWLVSAESLTGDGFNSTGAVLEPGGTRRFRWPGEVHPAILAGRWQKQKVTSASSKATEARPTSTLFDHELAN